MSWSASTRALPLAALACAAALGSAGCYDFDQAFQHCQDRGFCTDDGGTGGPVTVTVASLPDAYAGRLYTQTLTASGGNGAFAWSVTQGALPNGLSLSPDGVLSGTPSDPGPSSFTVTAASGGRTADAPLALEVLPPLLLATASLPDGYTGQAYSKAIAATGGKAPYVFAVQGAVPDGLSLSSSGTLSGTPTFAFDGAVTIAVRDANAQVTATPLHLIIYAPPAITTGQLPDGYTDQAYSVTLAVVDGKAPYAFSISAGTLPPGLSLDPATGQLSGNPTVPQNVSLIVTATDANGKSASRPLTLGVYAPVSITTAATLPDAYTQTAYDVTLGRSGGKGTVIWIASAGLPAGISLSIDGRLTGSPSTANSLPATFTVTATDGNGRSDTKSLSLGTYDLPGITTAALADGTLSVGYSDQLVGTGGKPPLTWMLGSGSLPNGLTLSSSGAVAGTPTTAGGSNFVVTVTDANGRTRSSTVTCTVYSALTISTPPTLAPGFAGGVPYSLNLAAAGGRSPYNWTLVAGSLPAPLALSASGTISGTPAAAGTSNFTVSVTDANTNTTTKSLTLGIVPAPSITTASLDDGYVGVAYAITVQAQDGSPPYTFSLTGALPNGLSLNTSTGQVSGTPSSAAAANVTVTLHDANGLTASHAYAFGTYATPSITTAALPDGYVGDAFSQALSSAGGKPPLTWSVAAGSFAAGLTLSGATGAVTGTPTAVQATSVTVRLSDANGRTASGIVAQQIYAPPSITTTLGDGYAGVAYPSTSLSVSGGKTPYSFAVTSGAVPSGMSFAGATGTLSGTPSAAGSNGFTVTVTDANGRAVPQPMSLPVYDLPAVSTASLADAYAGTAYSGALSGTGGKAPITWSVSSGTLPAGLSLSSGGAFSGSSGTAGSSTFTVQMTDANGRQSTRSLSLAVLSALQVTTSSVLDGYAGSAYSTPALGATGGRSPYTFSAVGALPAGLSLSGGGAFSGTPTASGTTTFDAKVTDLNNATAQRTLTLTVYSPPSIGGALADAYQGTSYSGALTGTAGKAPYTFAVTSGALPAGLSLSSGGTITGTPTTTGTSNFTVTLTDANSVTANRSLSVATLAPVAVSTPSLADAYQGRSYSMTLAATGGRAPYTFAVTTGALPGGLTLAGASGVISGTPGAVGSSNITVTATDANGVTGAQAFTLPVLAVPSITTVALPDGYASSAYPAASLAGTNGRAPYTFSVAGGLPPGLTLASGGAFSGTPTGGAASYPFTATLTDFNGVTAAANLTIAVWAALVVGGASLPDGYLTTAYSGSLAASGGKTPYTWSVAGGALPSGVTLTAASGALSGTPSAAGTASFTAQVADANGTTASGAKSIQTFSLPTITTTSPLANASLGSPYSQTLAVSGGKPSFTWSVTSGAPPAGITLAADGTLSGTANTPGTFTFTATVTDANSKTDSKSLSLQVVTGMNITTSAINDGYTTVFFSQTLAANGTGTTTWSVIGGTLTPGLSLAPGTGVLSGTPGSTGSFTFTVQASDTVSGTTSKSFTQTVYGLPSVQTTSLPDAYTDVAYSQTLAGTGGKPPYTWAITVGAPPSGITFNGGSSGTLTGQAAATGSTAFTVQVTDANNKTGTRPLTLTAYAPPAQTAPATLADGYTGRPYNATIATTGGKAPITFAVTGGGLPPGLTLNPGSGAISGSPGATGASNFTITATDNNTRTAVMAHTINVYAPPVVTTSSLPQGYYQALYSATLTATGGVAPLTWSVTAGALPSGLVMGGPNIGGNPNNPAGGTSNFTVTVTDANMVTASAPLSITTAAQLQITTASLADGYLTTAYNATVVSSGGRTPYTYGISSGALPAGLTMNAAGAISGTPTATGNASFVVTVTDNNNTQATRSLSIQVYPRCTITTTSMPDGYATQGYSTTLAGSGGKAPLSWSFSGGLPPGLTLVGGTGVVSGSPSVAGTTNPTFTLTDANGITANAVLPISVYDLPQITTPSPLPDGYSGQSYSVGLASAGGKGPMNWSVSGGALPPGLSLSLFTGAIGPSLGLATNGQTFNFTVNLADFNGRNAARAYTMTGYVMPSVTNTLLVTATEGITYMRQPGVFVAIQVNNGKAPYSYSAIGLPGGLTVDAPTGRILGIPSQNTAGTYTVTLRATDANGKLGSTSLPLSVVVPQPIRTGGANATAPTGSPITDALTVFVIDSSGTPISGAGVRVRKNGVEYAPAKDALTGVTGKAFFSGMNVSSGADTVDVTASGPTITTTTLAGVNAALVTLSVNRLDAPPLRAGAAASFDGLLHKLFVSMGSGVLRNPSAFTRNACYTDVQRLDTFSPTAGWTRTVAPGMNASPPGRTDAAFAYSGGGGFNANYLFGGYNCSGVALNDLWRYSGASNTWTQLTPGGGGGVPGPRAAAAMAADSSGKLAVFGGVLSGGNPTNELWRFDPQSNAWTNGSGGVPGSVTPRYGMGSTAFNGELWICGGFAGGVLSTSPVADCYSVDSAGTWTTRPSLPTPRSLFAMAADQANGRIYAFGGRTSSGDTSDLLYWSTSTNSWTQALPFGGAVAARERMAAFFDSAKLVVVGGNRQGEAVGMTDVDVYDPGNNTWTHTSGGFSPSTGFTISGTVRTGVATGGGPDGGSTGPDGGSIGPDGGSTQSIGGGGDAYVYATSSSGWDGNTVVNLGGGGVGSYSISGVPSGDTITLNAFLVDPTSVFPANVSSGVDLGVLGPINADTTADVNFPGGVSATVVSADVSVVSGWNLWTLFGNPFQSQNGYPFLRAQDGLGQALDKGKVKLAFFPPSFPGQQDVAVGGNSILPATCETSTRALANVGLTPPTVVLETPPRGLVPGLNECTPRGPAAQLSGTAVYRPGSLSATPNAVAAGDLNGDGVPDLAVSNGSDGTVQLLLGRGDGTYDFGSSFFVSGVPTAIAMAPLFGDPYRSVVVAVRSVSNSTVVIYRGDGQGNVAFHSSYAVGQDPGGLALADFNGDGFPELITANTTGQTLTVVFSRTGGLYTTPPTTLSNISCPSPHGVAVAKLDGDTLLDLVVACQGSVPPGYDNRVQIYRGLNASPWITSAPVITLNGPGNSGPFSVVAVDVDGNGSMDVAAANTAGPAMTVWKSNGNGTFQGPNTFGNGLANGAMGLAVADANADGKVDLVLANTGADQLLVFRNDPGGNGAFSLAQTIGTPRGPQGLAAADLNGDGRADVAAACSTGGALEILMQVRPLISQVEGAYQVQVPAGTGAVQLIRGPELQGMDWQYVTSVPNGATSLSIALPQTSALAPPPAGSSPSGQVVGWTVQAYESSAVDWNNFRFGLLRSDTQTQAGASLYVRQ